mmetsp:Transcript_20454/g.47865  ORF Transcript_20454/g.47865 Transcript_20454/m.47865 type:complete len:191 (-) Transcript_20454:67-639(-)|eukprot:CAMPEP_0171085242 /NCGR_PEP_ID=MMETSP0766_2-20121228/18818_1 /TAXON_ID=439317 /ORGANISM="Gambierdiscus australes, Strain CAWD 149" /LENGTH=190 /DNA_ID=CAMNT_0011542801 /DNA_START=83 /DNA_END=655 /DNA_ORIENTATION=+
MALIQGHSMLHTRRGPLPIMVLASALALLQKASLSFVPPPRVGPSSTSLRHSAASASVAPAGAAAAAVGLLPLATMPAASVAQGWEALVVTPLTLINTGLNLYKSALGIYAIMSWLFAFGIIDFRNDIVQKLQSFLSSIIDPVLAPLRSVIPSIAGFDISFMVLWFVIEQAQAAAVAIIFGALTYDNYYY